MLTGPLLLCTGAAAAAGSRILLPELTGPYKIGLTHLELIDESRPDPFSLEDPTAPRDLMVTLFYPAAANPAPADESSLAPQFAGPATASYIDALLSLPAGTAARLTTRAHLDAPISDPGSRPVALFSHGFGFTRGLYSALLSDLASRGWIAVSVDHPRDAGIVEYPDGRVARARPDWEWPLGPELREKLLGARVRDLLFALASLGDDDASAAAALPGTSGRTTGGRRPRPQFKFKLNTTRVAALGHSFGGATAAQALLDSAAVAAAADLDGFLYGAVARRGTRKPVLVLGFPEHRATDDPEAEAPAWPSLRGWKADFTVAGAVHESFSDYPVLRDVLELGGDGDGDGDGLGDVGSVHGERMVEIMGAYVGAFFERFVVGIGDGDGDGDGENRGLLDGNSSSFPEVSLRRKGDDQADSQQRSLNFEAAEVNRVLETKQEL